MQIEDFKALVSSLKNRLYRLANWMLHNKEDAEDLVQEVFLKLWRIRASLHEYRSVEALAVQMTKNLCINRIKSRRTYSDFQLEEIATTGHSPYKAFEDAEKLKIIKDVMWRLPDNQQVILQLKGVEGLETKEIAELLEETDNNVRVILSRARKNVKEAYEKYYSHEER